MIKTWKLNAPKMIQPHIEFLFLPNQRILYPNMNPTYEVYNRFP